MYWTDLSLSSTQITDYPSLEGSSGFGGKTSLPRSFDLSWRLSHNPVHLHMLCYNRARLGGSRAVSLTFCWRVCSQSEKVRKQEW